jgi:hypothetical protein
MQLSPNTTDIIMSTRTRLTALTLALVLPCFSFAPAATDDKPELAALAEARYQSAREFWDESWVVYTRGGMGPMNMSLISLRLLEAQLDRSEKDADKIAACQAHLDRITKMQAIATKVRRLGFSSKYEIKEMEFFRRDAEFRVARAKAH